MRTIRRLYFYTVAFISVEAILWGLITLIRTMFASNTIFPGPEMLAQALALIVVAIPIFLLHWLWVQNASARDEEENTSTLRAVFLYGILLATLIPVTQNILAFVDRTLIGSAGMSYERAFLGGQQTWPDNLVAIVLNLGAAAYFYNVLRQNWQKLATQSEFADVRRIYRYIWMLYGLIMGILGVQQVLRFIFYIPSRVIWNVDNETLINGIALILIGAPVWAWAWRICQQAIDQAEERTAILRLVVLYVLTLSGVVTVLTSTGVIISDLLRYVLSTEKDSGQLLQAIGDVLSVGIPFGAIWAYYGHWLNLDFEAIADLPRRAGMKRLYFYILSLIGLGATLIGLNMVASFMIDWGMTSQIWGNALAGRLSAAIATLLAGLPLWVLTWRPMQAEAMDAGDSGDHARRSLVRRSYLYLVVFICVIGGMFSAVSLVYRLLSAALGGTELDTVSALNSFSLLVLFGVFLIYHFQVMRRDGDQTTSALINRHAAFPVLIFERENSGFADEILTSVKRVAPTLNVASLVVEQGMHEDAIAAQMIILPADLALDPPESLRLWLKNFKGQRLVVPQDVPGWLWAGARPRNIGVQVAQMTRTLAEGQELRPLGGSSPWMVVIYLFAGLFALEIALLLFSLVVSAILGPL